MTDELWRMIESPHGHTGRRRDGKPCKATRFVVHTPEALDLNLKDGDQTAENIARILANPHARPASVHAIVDSDSIVQGRRLNDTAFGAPELNADGIHVEFAGFARYTHADWFTPRGKATLVNGALFCAEVIVYCKRELHLTWPLLRLQNARLRDRTAVGFCEHHDGTVAFKVAGGHTDPGSAFPWPEFFTQTRVLIGRLDKPGFKPHFHL